MNPPNADETEPYHTSGEQVDGFFVERVPESSGQVGRLEQAHGFDARRRQKTQEPQGQAKEETQTTNPPKVTIGFPDGAGIHRP